MDSKNNNNKPASNEQNKIAENNPSKAMDSKREVAQSNDPKTDQDFPGYPHYPAKEDIMDKRTDSHRVDEDVENLPNSHNVTGVDQRFRTGRNEQSEDESQGAQKKNEVRPEDDFRDINPRTESGRANAETLNTTNAEMGVPQNVNADDLNPDTDLQADLNTPTGTDADVSLEERISLENVFMPTDDDDNLRRAAMDNGDNEGEPLNEEGFGEVLSGVDLDVPGTVDETRTTALGQGDEENKYYSLGGDLHENDEEDPYSGPERGNEQ